MGDPINLIDSDGLAPDWAGPAGTVAEATGAYLVFGSPASAVPHVRAVGGALILGGLGLQVWAATSTEDQVRDAVELMDPLRDLTDELNEVNKELQQCE